MIFLHSLGSSSASYIKKGTATLSFTMSSINIPNELTTLKTEKQKDMDVDRAKKLERKSQWIQVRVKS